MPPLFLFLAGAAAGAGAALVAPALAPEATRNLRPVLRAGLKLAITAGAAMRTAAAEAVETVEDLYAEAQAELADPPPATPVPAKPKRAPRRKRSTAPADA